MMYLSGEGWEVKRRAFKEKQEQKKKDEEESKEPPSPFPTPNLCAFIGIGSSEQEMIRLSLEDKVWLSLLITIIYLRTVSILSINSYSYQLQSITHVVRF